MKIINRSVVENIFDTDSFYFETQFLLVIIERIKMFIISVL